MNRRRFLGTAAWLAAGTALAASGCSSDATQGTQAGQEADNKQILDSAEANNKAGARNNPRSKSRSR